jgi:dihydrofolate reductase
MTDVPLAIVAAVARNGVIGAKNGLPWRLYGDLKRFKSLTWGKPLVMGRKTFQSIGRSLPGRETIVVSRDPAFAPAGVAVAPTLEAALDLAAERARGMAADAIIIAGGAEIYAQTIERASRLFITEVALEPEGDARFPPIDPDEWREIRREEGERGPRDDADFAFVDYERLMWHSLPAPLPAKLDQAKPSKPKQEGLDLLGFISHSESCPLGLALARQTAVNTGQLESQRYRVRTLTKAAP